MSIGLKSIIINGKSESEFWITFNIDDNIL